MKYDITGNVMEETVNYCRRKTFTYGSDYQYAYPTSSTRGDTGQLTVSATYDFNMGLMRISTDENNQTCEYRAVYSQQSYLINYNSFSTHHKTLYRIALLSGV